MSTSSTITPADKRSPAGLITLFAEGFLVTSRRQETPAGFFLDLDDDWPVFPRLVYVTGDDLLETVGGRSTVIVALAEIRFRCDVRGYSGRGSDAVLLLGAASFFRGIARELERSEERPVPPRVREGRGDEL